MPVSEPVFEGLSSSKVRSLNVRRMAGSCLGDSPSSAGFGDVQESHIVFEMIELLSN